MRIEICRLRDGGHNETGGRPSCLLALIANIAQEKAAMPKAVDRSPERKLEKWRSQAAPQNSPQSKRRLGGAPLIHHTTTSSSAAGKQRRGSKIGERGRRRSRRCRRQAHARAKANAKLGLVPTPLFTAASSSDQPLSLPANTLAPDTWLESKQAWRSA